MHNLSAFGRRSATLLLTAACLASSSAFAVDTRIWDQSDESDFSHGTVKQLSIRSDGRLSLAPEFKELDSTTIPYLWAVVQDSKGVLYYAGGAPTGATTRVMSMQPGGKSKVYAELTGLEIHALAIDAQDRLYAAVQPDAKVYRIDKDGKATLFFDTKQKYVWSMVFDKSGNLYLATGDAGIVYKVTPDGKGSEFARTQETHARSMILSSAGDLIVGTEPSGLVIRIHPDGETFVLYQTAKREVTALAEHGGLFYAAAVGNKTSGLQVSGPAPVLPATPQPVSPTGQQRVPTATPAAPPPIAALNVAVSGGSEVYRIQGDGFAERIWQSPSDLVYAMVCGSSGKPILGTGNKGVIYRIESPQMATQLLTAPPTQVTGFLQEKGGLIYAITGNVGNLYSIGPSLAAQGTLESDVLDAGEFSYWGKAHTTNTLRAGTIALETRSGNLNSPQHDWSPWSKVEISPTGGEVHAPAARFLQYRLTLERSKTGESPEVSAVDIPFLSKNIAPRVSQIETAPLNYRESPSGSSLERTLMSSGSPSTISVPAVGQKRSQQGSSAESSAAPAATLQYSKGFLTVRWSASDQNGDPLAFRVEIRPRSTQTWHLLKDKLQDRYYSFDTAAWPDGEYVVRVTASDAPGNVAGDALSSSLESDPITIDNTPPEIIAVKPVDGYISFTAKDALSWIAKAEYSVDGGEWTTLLPVNKVSDSQIQEFKVSAGRNQGLTVRVFDDADNVSVRQLTP